jgi:uncharacterized membrane protein
MKNQSTALIPAPRTHSLPGLLHGTVALSLLAAASAAFAQPRYALADLGVLPGHVASTAYGLNDHGDVVGASDHDAFGWSGGVLDPATGGGWTITSVAAINNRGQIAGVGTVNGASHAILLTPLQ